MMDRLPEAVAEFRIAVSLKPGDATLRFNLALALMDLGQKQEAIEQLQEALKLNPNFEEARAALAAAKTNVATDEHR
jgi:predicted Zn-dependent protease